jgi:hypothetical protein
MRGYGYGASGLWNDVFSRGDEPLDAGTEFELVGEPDTGPEAMPHPYAPTTRRMWWFDGAQLPTGDLLGIGATYLRALPWWRLEPRFDDPDWSDLGRDGRDLLASDGRELYLALFTSDGTATGSLRGLSPIAAYEAEWMNLRTGERHMAGIAVTESGECCLPDRPTAADWLLQVRCVGANP